LGSVALMGPCVNKRGTERLLYFASECLEKMLVKILQGKTGKSQKEPQKPSGRGTLAWATLGGGGGRGARGRRKKGLRLFQTNFICMAEQKREKGANGQLGGKV